MADARRVVAPFALAALSVVGRAVARAGSSTRAGSCCPCVGAALLPHAFGALVRWRGWSVLDRRGRSPSSALVGLRRGRARAVDDHVRDLPRRRHLAHARARSSPAAGTCCAPRPRRRRRPTARILLAVLAVWVMAALADWLAFRRQTRRSPRSRPRSCSSCGRRRSAPTTTQLLLTVALLRRRRRVRPRAEHRGARPAPQLAGVATRRAPALAGTRGAARRRAPIVVALVVAPLVPGSDADPCSTSPAPAATARVGTATSRRWRRSSTSARKLDDVDNVELFTVQPNVARLLAHRRARPYSGDDGGQWTLSAEGDDSVQRRAPRAPRPTARWTRSSPSVRSANAGSPPRSARWPSTCPTRSS